MTDIKPGALERLRVRAWDYPEGGYITKLDQVDIRTALELLEMARDEIKYHRDLAAANFRSKDVRDCDEWLADYEKAKGEE